MRSTAARVTLGVAAWIAFGAAAFFVVRSERQLTARRNGVRTFDVIAREASASLATVRAAQQAYVAQGQGPGFWMSKVDVLLGNATSRIEELRQVAASVEAGQLLGDAATAIDDLRGIDKRARQYLNSDDALMAADVVFSEGGDTAAAASRKIEAARQAEFVAWDAAEAERRRNQLYAAAGAAGLGALVIALLLTTRPARQAAPAEPHVLDEPAPRTADADFNRRSASTDVSGGPLAVSPELPRETVPVLQAAVELCGELNRVRELDDLNRLLGRAAQIMEASGLVVWVGTPTATQLRPALAFGYSPQALARMSPVSRTGDNAAAAAFRTGVLQIVLTRPGISGGAIAAPMLSPDGCIGALTAEIKNGSETSDGIQALAAIFASQLAGVLADSILHTADAESTETRVASA
jgi:hypothetical protein